MAWGPEGPVKGFRRGIKRQVIRACAKSSEDWGTGVPCHCPQGWDQALSRLPRVGGIGPCREEL